MKVVRVAYIVAFVMAVLIAWNSLLGLIVHLPTALVPLFAGIGILRRRVWSAYGFTVYLIAQILLAVYLLISADSFDVIAQVVLTAAIIPLFFFAGRSLARSGAPWGLVWPWIGVAALTTIPFFFVRAFQTPTGSMENTLLTGDRFLVRTFPKPSLVRGDLVAFFYPIDRHQKFVKRVIGVPGDHLKIVEKTVYVNGATLSEPYVVHKSPQPDASRDNLPTEPSALFANAGRDMLKNNVVNGEVVVPQGKYFVLGDNRDNSLDSRYWGFVGSGDVIGKPFLIYESNEIFQDITPPDVYPPRRWNRLFKFV